MTTLLGFLKKNFAISVEVLYLSSPNTLAVVPIPLSVPSTVLLTDIYPPIMVYFLLFILFRYVSCSLDNELSTISIGRPDADAERLSANP